MKIMQRTLVVAVAVASACAMLTAQAPGGGKGGGKGAPKGPVLSVTSPAWPDGGEVPMNNAGRGGNKSPMFEFHWSNGNDPAAAPDALQTYAIIFHDIENAGQGKTTTDTLHWSAFNIPGSTKTLPEGLAGGDLPDGTRNGPGINATRGMPSYFGPGAGVGPFHHYVFEFYALDSKIDLPATTTREELMKAMDGHVIGKAAYVGRFHATP
jgi:Raf kinase inhibitor-like YbhB/YbcL family protein